MARINKREIKYIFRLPPSTPQTENIGSRINDFFSFLPWLFLSRFLLCERDYRIRYFHELSVGFFECRRANIVRKERRGRTKWKIICSKFSSCRLDSLNFSALCTYNTHKQQNVVQLSIRIFSSFVVLSFCLPFMYRYFILNCLGKQSH